MSFWLRAGTLTFIPGPTGDSDEFWGDSSNDTASALGDNDALHGGQGDDTLNGNEGDDYVDGGEGNDILYGEDGVDDLDGFSGNDTLNGGAGNDTLDGHEGNDTISGGDGNDIIYTSFNAEVDFNWVDGGDGVDWAQLNFQDETASVVFSLVNASSGTGQGVIDGSHVRNVERIDIHTGSGNDQVNFGASLIGRNDFQAGAGTDRLMVDLSDAAGVVSLSHFFVGIDQGQPAQRGIYHGGVEAFTVTSGAFDDGLEGGSGDDVLSGNGGNDLIRGYEGHDTLNGGDGNDTLDGRQGDDTISGGAGDDIIYTTFNSEVDFNWVDGGDGVDFVQLNLQDETLAMSFSAAAAGSATGQNFTDGTHVRNAERFNLQTGSGNDVLDFGSGVVGRNDLHAGAGNDRLIVDFSGAVDAVSMEFYYVGIGKDLASQRIIYFGSVESFVVAGGSGSDQFNAQSEGDDVLTGNGGNDTLLGGGGNDLLNGGADNDTLGGGGGDDTATYAAAGAAVAVSLAVSGAQDTGGAGIDTLSEIENLIGSSFNDALTGSAANNALSGGGGDDVLAGGAGDDVMTGGDGIDTASYAGVSSGVAVSLAIVTNQNTGGAGIDRLAGVEGLIGSDHDDTLTGNALANTLVGGLGDDALLGGGGADTIVDEAGASGVASILGGGGDDVIALSGTFASGVVNGGAGVDQVTFGGLGDAVAFTGVEILNTTGGVTTASAAQFRAFATIRRSESDLAGAVTLAFTTGGVLNLTNKAAGRDVHLTGSTIIDVITGSDGNDVIDGLAGGDTLNGGAGDDTLTGGDGADKLNGGDGADTLHGGAGNDTIGGGVGNDTITDIGGVVVAINGGEGDDIITLGTTFQSGTVNGGLGFDQVNAGGFLRGVAFVGVEVLNTGGGLVTATAAQMEAFETIRVSAADTAGAVSLRLSEAGAIDLAGELGTRVVSFTGSAGDDDIRTGDGGDTVTGGTGNDLIRTRAGDDLILQASTDGRDIIDGGGGHDTYRLTGTAAAETFRIYTRAEALAAGMTGLAAGTEIVVTRDGTDNAAIIAELDNIEEIEINALLSTANNGNGSVDGGSAGGDTIIVLGDFTQTNLDYSTIRIAGSAGSDTIDISGLTSAHRVVFTSNGGEDSIIGQPRPQDVFEGVAALVGAPGGSSLRSVVGLAEVSARLQSFQPGLSQDREDISDLLSRADLTSRFDAGVGRAMLDMVDDLASPVIDTANLVATADLPVVDFSHWREDGFGGRLAEIVGAEIVG